MPPAAAAAAATSLLSASALLWPPSIPMFFSISRCRNHCNKRSSVQCHSLHLPSLSSPAPASLVWPTLPSTRPSQTSPTATSRSATKMILKTTFRCASHVLCRPRARPHAAAAPPRSCPRPHHPPPPPPCNRFMPRLAQSSPSTLFYLSMSRQRPFIMRCHPPPPLLTATATMSPTPPLPLPPPSRLLHFPT